MNFGFVVRPSKQHGGDTVAINSAAAGLKSLGHRVFFGHSVQDVRKSDYVFLSNSCLDLRHFIPEIKKRNGRYGIITFQEDFRSYFRCMMGFCSYVSTAVSEGSLKHVKNNITTSIEHMKEYPDIVQEWAMGLGQTCNPTIIINRELTENASNLFVHSQKEKDYFHKRIPNSKPHLVRWSPGIATGERESDDSFLKLTGLKKGEYVLSVGRLEGRKNQLASLMALYDSDHTVVLTTPSVYNKEFSDLLLEIASRRKGDTIVVAQDLPSQTKGTLTVLGLDKKLLPNATLNSAFANAGLHLHPAFYEMPGLTYLEAAHHNIPQVASSWTSIDEYFSLGGDPSLGGRVEYVDPHNIVQIEEAVNKQFGKTFDPLDSHPALTRTNEDVARDIMDGIK